MVRRGENGFVDFIYWNFSGRAPGVGYGEEREEDGELARWRSSAFAAVSGKGISYRIAFKARLAISDGAPDDTPDAIYLAKGPKHPQLIEMIKTGMDGIALDPEAVDSDTGLPLPITELGIERDGFRGEWIVINASMGSEETGWAGVYLTDVR